MIIVLKKYFVIFLLFLIFTYDVNGFIKEWIIAGPFKFQRGQDPIRLKIIENEKLPLFKEGNIIAGKKCIKYISRTNYVELDRVYPDENLDYSICYSAVNIYFEEQVSNMKIFVGSDDYILVYLNGQPLHYYNRGRRWLLPSVDCIENVNFKKGWNQLVLKVINIVSGYSYFACITDKDGEFVHNLKLSTVNETETGYALDSDRITESLSSGSGKGTGTKHWLKAVFTDSKTADIKNPEKVEIFIDRNNIINNDFKGAGIQGDLFLWLDGEQKVSKDDRIKITNRVKKLRPSLVRLFLMTEWWNPEKNVYDFKSKGMYNLCNVLDLYKEINSDIIITIWRFTEWINPIYNIENARDLAISVTKLMEFLIREKKYENIKYLIIYNEPDIEFRKSVSEYRYIYELLDKELKKSGLREKLKLTAPDDSNSFKFFRETVDTMDDLIDVYDSHHYEGYDAVTIEPWIEDRILKLKEKNIKKPFIIGEFGMWNISREPFYYGRFIAEYVITALNSGVDGLLLWEMQSNPYPGEGGLNDGGIWEYKYTGWRLRPAYYAYSILTRNLRPGMKVVRARSSSIKVMSVAFYSESKSFILLSNRANTTNIEISGDFTEGKSFLKYLYNESTVSRMDTDDDTLLEAIEIRVNSDNRINDTLPEDSFVLYMEN